MVIPAQSKSSNRGRKLLYWDFVINNYSCDDCERVKRVLKNLCESYVVGKEVGESGTPHLQAAVKLKKPNYKSALLKSEINCENKMSVRPGRNVEAMKNYCLKGGDILCQENLDGFKKEKKLTIEESYNKNYEKREENKTEEKDIEDIKTIIKYYKLYWKKDEHEKMINELIKKHHKKWAKDEEDYFLRKNFGELSLW